MQRYDLFTFGAMIGPAAARRVAAYGEALRRTVTPSTTVLDIGTGVGYFAVLAARFGARHVYGVDPNPAIVLAPEIAAANDVAERTTFLRGLSTEIDLPERVDVIVSDIRGSLPWLQAHIPAIADARARHLVPGGVLIPARDDVWATVVRAPRVFARHVAPWSDHEIDLAPARRRACDHVRKAPVSADAMVVEPQRVATLDYSTISDPDASAELRWTVTAATSAHGLAMWFDTELIDGVTFSNAPSEPQIPTYSQTFFPWREPIELEVGDEIAVRFRCRLAGRGYVWSWATRVRSPSGDVRAGFDQVSLGAGAGAEAGHGAADPANDDVE